MGEFVCFAEPDSSTQLQALTMLTQQQTSMPTFDDPISDAT